MKRFPRSRMAKRVLSMIWMRFGDRQFELVGKSPSAITGKSSRGGVRRIEVRAAGLDLHLAFGGSEDDLGAFGQLARDFEQGVRRRRSWCGVSAARDGFDDLQIKVSRHRLELAARIGFDQDVRQDRNRVAPFDHRLDVAGDIQELRVQSSLSFFIRHPVFCGREVLMEPAP